MLRFLIFLLMIVVYPCSALAFPLEGTMMPPLSSIEVTSPFGWRTHPITGKETFHAGVDLGADYEDIVYAAGDGVIEVSSWVSGYGNCIYIDHGSGVETVYGHNETLLVPEGAFVRKGTPIALAGSTGNSTGPHCHFEVDVDGEPQDPGLFAPGIGTGQDAKGGKLSDYMHMDSDTFGIDFTTLTDIAKPLRDGTEAFGKACTEGLRRIKGLLKYVFMLLITMDLIYASFVYMIERKPGVVRWVLVKVMMYGFIIFMLANWGDFVANASRDMFSTFGAAAVGKTAAEAEAAVSDPTMIVQKGFSIIAPVFNKIAGISGPMILHNIPLILVALVFGFLIMGCFLLVGIQIALAYIEFYIVMLFGFTWFVLAGEKHTRQFAANGFNGIFAVSFKFMFYCFFALLMSMTMENMVVESLTSSQTNVTSDSTVINGQAIHSIDDFMAAIRQVETGGCEDPYHTPSADGYGYGAYQISYDNWHSWCITAGVTGPIDPATGDPEWTPENQDRVARVIMLNYYEEYGNWHDVAVRWNGGSGAVDGHWSATEDYWQKVKNAVGHEIDTTLNVLLLIKLFVVAVMFVIIGSRVAATFNKEFGSPGFKFDWDSEQ